MSDSGEWPCPATTVAARAGEVGDVKVVGETEDRLDASGSSSGGTHFVGFESLRALAALLVVVHHAAQLAGSARAGVVATPAAVMDGGVAVFFVLSGFLIYRPFVASQVARRPSSTWRSFWWRRVLRIVPAYWVVLTLFWWLGSFELGSAWWRYYLFLQIYSADTVLRGVVQAWSLCTEMAFYLLVPLWAGALAVAGRRLRPDARLALHAAACAALWIGGWVARWGIERWAPSRRGVSFTWLPTNLDLFAAGMALAVVSVAAAQHAGVRARLDRAAGAAWAWWVAAAALFTWYAYAVGAVDFETGYAGWFWHRRQLVLAVVSVLAMVPVVFGDQRRGLLRRWWAWRPVVWVGTVSYGLYLWHFDLMKRALDSGRWDGGLGTSPGDSSLVWLLAVGVGLGLACAALSWYLLEKPLQRFKSPGAVRRPGTPRQ